MKAPKFIFVIAAATFGLVASTITALAVPATATTGVNVRSGPGVSFAIVDTLHAGQAVDVIECQGNWCFVEKTGPDGWVSGNYLEAAAPPPAPQNNAANDAAAAAALNIFGTILGAIINNAAPPPPAAILPLNGEYSIRQKSNGRYLDAHQGVNDNSAVTRNNQNNDTQVWIISAIGGNVYTIRQKSSGRYLDAHQGINDNSAVTRNNQNNDTQRWIISSVGGNVYTIQQKSSNRYLDAHEGVNDNSAVTRAYQNNDTQRWIIQ